MKKLAKFCERNDAFYFCNILSTITNNLLPSQKVRDLLKDKDKNNPNGQGYDFGWGTSYAAAHVSGLVSLMMSVNEKLKSKPAAIEEILCKTAIPLPPG
jgi:subtilisin family serine protease